MEFLELQNNFYILNKVQVKNNVVYVCRNKQSYLYNFFYEQNNKFFEVNKDDKTYLKQIYKENTKDYVNFYCSNDYNKTEQKILSSVHSICRYLICEYAENLTPQLQEKFKDKLNHVAYNKVKLKTKTTLAYYKYKEHIIDVNFSLANSPNFIVPTILHELTHAIASDNKQTTTGILIDYDIKTKNDLHLKLNDAFNEAYTEILRERFLENYNEYNYDKNHICYYNPIKHLMNVMISYVDNKKDLDLAYFNNDGYKFLDILCDAFKIENREEMLNLSLQFDAFIDALSYAVEHNENDRKTAFSYITTMGNTICDFVLNKYQKENLDIKNLKFEDIFKQINLNTSIDKNYWYALLPVKTYFLQQQQKMLSNKQEEKPDLSVKDYLKNYALKFVDCAFKDKPLNQDFPQDLKSPQLFNLVLSNRFLKENNYTSLKDKTEIFKTIFNENNNFLPTDNLAKAKIVDNLIYKRDIDKNLFSLYVPKDILTFVINNKNSTFNYLCEFNFDVLFQNINNINYDKKTSKRFYFSLLQNIANNENKMDILKAYFKDIVNGNNKNSFSEREYVALAKFFKVVNDEELQDLAKYVNNLNKDSDKSFA